MKRITLSVQLLLFVLAGGLLEPSAIVEEGVEVDLDIEGMEMFLCVTAPEQEDIPEGVKYPQGENPYIPVTAYIDDGKPVKAFALFADVTKLLPAA